MSQRPNILFMMPDQLRADFLGCYGAEFAQTPHIDALAAGGTRFERCLSPNPICVPARASLLTGTTSLENGVTTNSNWLRPDLSECGIETWPALLAQKGYATYGVGKMHFYPWDAGMGFQHRAIAEDKRQIGIGDDYADYLASMGHQKIHAREMPGYVENGGACISPLAADEQVDAWCADRAVDYLNAHDTRQPFAMMVGFPSPHCPYDPPSDVVAAFDPADMPEPYPPTAESERLRPWLIANMKNPWADIDYETFNPTQIGAVRAHYSALVHLVDRAVGRIIEALDRLGMTDNTLVVFASDHGDFVGDFGMVCKNFFMDGSVRVPMILRGPGQKRGLRQDAVTLSDLYPTLLDTAGVTPRTGLDFYNLSTAQPDRVICGATHRGFMIERNRMKLARYVGGLVTLYDMNADPEEQRNLAIDPAHRATRDELETLLTDWQVEQAQKGNADKAIPPQSGASTCEVSKRGWVRPYPYNIHAKART